MFEIQLFNKINKIGTDLLDATKYNLVTESENPDAILLRSYELNGMKFGSKLKAIGRAGAGVNNIPVDECTKAGIVVFNTPGANANGVKELVIGALMLASRDIIDGVNWVKTLKDTDGVEKAVEKGKNDFGGTEVGKKTLGIIGLGAIGVLVANAANHLGMEVIGYDPFISVNSAWNLSQKVKRAENLDELYKNCDYISMHIPLVEQTKKMINKAAISKMKDNVKILNFSRAGLVDNNDMIEAVVCGYKVGVYITDFPQNELIGVKNIICIPHLGASTEESEENCAVYAVNEVKNYLEYGNIKNSVNFPDCEIPVSDFHRICIMNKNIPDVINKITQILSKRRINIEQMVNRSKGDYSYNIIEVDAKNIDDIYEELAGIEGVINVRFI